MSQAGGMFEDGHEVEVSNDTCVFKDFEECKHWILSPNIVNIDVLIAKHYQEDWDGDRDEEEEEEARESPSQEEDGSQVEVEEGEVSFAAGV